MNTAENLLGSVVCGELPDWTRTCILKDSAAMGLIDCGDFTTPYFVFPNVTAFTSSALLCLFFCLASFNFHFLLCFPLSPSLSVSPSIAHHV